MAIETLVVRTGDNPEELRAQLEALIRNVNRKKKERRKKGEYYPCGLRRLQTAEEKEVGHIWVGMTISNDHIPRKGEPRARPGLKQLKDAVKDTRMYEKDNGRTITGKSGKKWTLQSILRHIYPIFGDNKSMTNDDLLRTCYDFGIDAAAVLGKKYVGGKWVYES